MTQKTFSEFIGKSQGTISSIFTGRTRASLEIIEAIKAKFPTLSTDWLVFGTGDMFESEPDANLSSSDSASPSSSEMALEFGDSEAQNGENPAIISNPKNSKKSLQNSPQELVKVIEAKPRRITEIRVFYDDQTWESYHPENK